MGGTKALIRPYTAYEQAWIDLKRTMSLALWHEDMIIKQESLMEKKTFVR